MGFVRVETTQPTLSAESFCYDRWNTH